MQSYGTFFDDWQFDVGIGTRMGSGVAAMGLPIEQILDLIPLLDIEEMEAEVEGWIDTRNRVATMAFLTTWATDSAFPSA